MRARQEEGTLKEKIIFSSFCRMKVLSVFTCIMYFQLLFNNGSVVNAIRLKQFETKKACPKKETLMNNADAIKRDLRGLFNVARLNPQYKGSASVIFSYSSKFKDLSQDKLIERLYLHHKALKTAFRFLGQPKKANQKIGNKIFNIIVQIKQLAELLRNNAHCNPGQPGVGFVFKLPKTPPSSSISFSDFLYNMAVLSKEIFGDFDKNVLEFIKFSLGE